MKPIILITLVALALAVSGCETATTEGVLIGAGTSTALTESQALAKQRKEVLVDRIIELQNQLEKTTDPVIVADLKEKLAAAQQKQQIAELTDAVATQVQEGLARDWSEPTRPDNLAWILGSAATVLGGYGAKKTYDDKKKTAALNSLKIAAKPENERAVYEKIGTA